MSNTQDKDPNQEQEENLGPDYLQIQQDQLRKYESLGLPLTKHGTAKGLPDACVFVSPLSEQTTEQKLKEFVEKKFGMVIRCSIRKEASSKKGSGAFIQFVNLKDADLAISQSNKHTLDDRVLRIYRAKVNTTVFANRVPRSMTCAELRAVAEEFGPVISVRIVFKETQNTRGSGFIKYIYREDAKDAMTGLELKFPDWTVCWSKTNDEIETDDPYTIVVANLNSTKINESLLRERFEKYGEIKQINIVVPPNFEDRIIRNAFAFITFADTKSAIMSMENENYQVWHGSKIRVQHKLPELKTNNTKEIEKKGDNVIPPLKEPQEYTKYYNTHWRHYGDLIPVPPEPKKRKISNAKQSKKKKTKL